jgi:glycosyltransferase involved in cell wall biosynthesis
VKRVKVGFDATPLVRPLPRGIVRAARGQLEALERRGRLEVVRLAPPPGASLRRWRGRELPHLARELALDGVHSFLSAFPLTARPKRVQTVHELPWLHGVAENADLRHRLWARLGPLRAHAVVCGTEHAARELRAYCLGGAQRVRVIPWGVGPEFAPDPPPGAVDEVLLERYRLGEVPFALCLDAVRPKKNLSAVLGGLAELRRGGGPELRVVVTGEDTPQLRRDLGLASRLGLAGAVKTVGAVDEADLPGLLRLASVVPVLSHSEGFGFPVIEALACGTPALVPAGSAQAEVAGAFGIAVDARSEADVARGLSLALEQREELRFELPARAAELSWDASAAKVETLWEELAA